MKNDNKKIVVNNRESPTVSYGRVWWLSIHTRLEEVKLTLPANIQGVIQFEVKNSPVQDDNFYLYLDGAKTRCVDGYVAHFDTHVLVDEAAMETMLRNLEPKETVFLVQGNALLYKQFFTHLSQVTQPQSWLGIRAKP